MQANSQRKRAGKRLLVAAIGVATVSFVGAQSGCAPDTDSGEEERAENAAPYDDEVVSPALSEQSLTISGTELKLPPSGNLLPPPPPSGNLMAPPGTRPPVIKPPVVVLPPPSGNLMPPIPIHELEQFGVKR